ncbi:MAG TPA: protein kinase [Gemmatimonadales bacterium]|nr:protein kinase [Gemmatimonadales bacterium]
MTPERWREVRALFTQALEREPAKRAAFLDEVCGNDTALHQEVESLLKADAGASGYLEPPAARPLAQPDLQDRLAAALSAHYRLERVLGEGGMATVYLAHDLKHGRQVALKVLKPELSAVLGAQRFLNEIQVTANLSHPHILPLYDSGSAEGALFYVMPLVHGESLRQRITRDKVLPVDEAITIARQLASALDFAHRQGVIHRDIKPENIYVQEGDALLADFGVALALSEAAGGRLTGTGVAMGTVEYMSPEQAEGAKDLDARSDVYALSAVTYEMLAGHPPLTGTTVVAIITKLLTETPVALRSLRPEVPRAVDSAVMRALAKDPRNRYSTAREFADALVGPEPLATQQIAAKARAIAPSRRSRAIFFALLGLIVAAGVWAVAGRGLAVHSSSNSPEVPTLDVIRSIAVLPLDNYSGDSTQDYFAEGMTDQLTATLATISQLRVTSRGSAMQFQGKARPATPVIARTLDVDAVVEGSVVRSGNKVRITAQLIDARADRHLWAKSFERNSEDVLALQSELARAIAGEINVRLTESEQSRLATASTVDPEAYDAYLRGRYFFNRPSDENLQKAIAQFEESVKLSPNFAPGYSGLSDAYLWAGYNEGFLTASQARPKAKAAAEKAVELDSNSAEAHTSLAVFKTFYEFDWVGSEKEFRRAIELNPNYAFTHDMFSLSLAFVGRYDESIAEGRRAAQLDPLSPQVLVDAITAPMFQKDFATAKAWARKAIELDPTYFFAVMADGWVDLDAGNARQAIPSLRQAQKLGAPPFVTAFLAYAYGAAGDRENALAQLDTLKKISPGGRVLPFNLALVYLGLGDHERALDNLERARSADSQMMAWLGGDAIFNPLRSAPRFKALMKSLNFE